MKSSQIAAAVLAAITTTTANAEILEKTMCIPASTYEGQMEIYTLCDASEVNKKNNIKLNSNGCAVSGQTTEDGGILYDQASMTIWAETKKDLKKQMLPKCDNFDAAIYAVEL